MESPYQKSHYVSLGLSLIFLILTIAATFLLGVAIGTVNTTYAIVVVGALVTVLILLLRIDELIAALIIAAHILIDAYLGFATYQIALLMALLLLLVCYFGRSVDHPWSRPRWVWLWLVFLMLNIIPTLKGGAFDLTNSIGYYLEVVFSPFIMFWLGNILARDIAGVRRVFQWLSLLAALFAIHTIIEATTGVFLFESARAQANLQQASNYQIAAGVSRASSFFGNPNGNGAFLAMSFFLPLGLFIESNRFGPRIIYLLQMILILMALMRTYSNGSWIAALTGLLIFMFLVGRVRYSVLLCMLVAALAVIALTVFAPQVAIQLARARNQGDLSLHLATWQTAMRVIAAYPVFGVGLGSQAYLILSSHYRVPAQSKPLAEPDNSYLQWGAIAGIPVMLIFLILLTLVFWYSWRNWLAVEIRYRALLAGGIVALIALSINSLTVDGWTSPIDVQFLGWLIAGIVASPLIGHRSGNTTTSKTSHSIHSLRSPIATFWIDKVKQGS
jgi:O-antigen ligase